MSLQGKLEAMKLALQAISVVQHSLLACEGSRWDPWAASLFQVNIKIKARQAGGRGGYPLSQGGTGAAWPPGGITATPGAWPLLQLWKYFCLWCSMYELFNSAQQHQVLVCGMSNIPSNKNTGGNLGRQK